MPTTMPRTMRTNPAPSHFAPVRVTRACDAGASETRGAETAAIGAPQPGQAAALSETSLPHSAHLMRAMCAAFYAPAFFLADPTFSASAACVPLRSILDWRAIRAPPLDDFFQESAILAGVPQV